MSQLRAPLIVDERGDLKVFRDATSMEGWMEAIDVQNNEFVVYDSEGRLLELTTARTATRALFGLLKGSAEVVRISSVEADPTHATELHNKLRTHLERLKVAVPPQATLPDLVGRLQERAGFVA